MCALCPCQRRSKENTSSVKLTSVFLSLDGVRLERRRRQRAAPQRGCLSEQTGRRDEGTANVQALPARLSTHLNPLPVVLKVYHEPLTAALNSNRAILSFADIHTVLSPVAQILELNRCTNTLTNSDDTAFVAWRDRLPCVLFAAGCFRLIYEPGCSSGVLSSVSETCS